MFVGIVAEYNPFHNGHAAQLAAAHAAGADCIAVAMSAGAVQRGEVPILPESVRVRAALAGGADLIAALPAPYACAGAEAFAAAGVRLLAALGCDTLAFGAETPDAARLMDAARLLLSEKINAELRKNLDNIKKRAGSAVRRGLPLPRLPAPVWGRCCASRTTFWAWNTARQF